MKSEQLRALMLRSMLVLAMLCLPACVGAPPIAATPIACSRLLPKEWRKEVPGAELPRGRTVGDIAAFADAQTGQLDKANDRTLSSIAIVEECEALMADAVKRSRRKFLGIF